MITNLSHILTPRTLHFKKGEQVFIQAKIVTNIYYIVRGRVKLVRNTVEGTPIIVHIAYAGEGLAEASLFCDKYHCSAQVDTNTEVIYFSKVKLLDYLHKNPDAMMDLIEQLTLQVRDLRMFNEIKSIYSAKERILTYLLTQKQTPKLPLKDIAQKIGITHETLYRTLRTLEYDKTISRNNGEIKLINTQ